MSDLLSEIKALIEENQRLRELVKQERGIENINGRRVSIVMDMEQLRNHLGLKDNVKILGYNGHTEEKISIGVRSPDLPDIGDAVTPETILTLDLLHLFKEPKFI